jgi:hypothetical protein
VLSVETSAEPGNARVLGVARLRRDF